MAKVCFSAAESVTNLFLWDIESVAFQIGKLLFGHVSLFFENCRGACGKVILTSQVNGKSAEEGDKHFDRTGADFLRGTFINGF
ncbi:hypothetical protein SDC9_177630 [bioreactor metagenome]|uniref:Uncharacterized protein n=1 Tax=bioreactor metagenome TaxID=1076179 RepID=A0A645GVV9_9ZZZZ